MYITKYQEEVSSKVFIHYGMKKDNFFFKGDNQHTHFNFYLKTKHLHKIANGQTNSIKITVFRANYNKFGFNLEF